MKLESDPPFCHSTTNPKCAPKSLECNCNTLELQNQVMKENQIRLSFEGKINQKDANQSPYSSGDGNGCVATKINCSSIDDFDVSTDGTGAFLAPSSKKPSDSYVDKSVMECQLSRTIVCCKEINVNDVKDICIDEGVSSLESIFSVSTDEKPICKILPPEEDQSEGFTKEREDSSELSKSIADDLKFSVEKQFVRDWTIRDDSKDLTQIEVAKFNVSDPEPSMQELVNETHPSKSLDNICNDVKIMSMQISGERANLEDPASVSKAVKPCNGNSALDSVAESPNDDNLTNASAYNSEVGNGSITFDFNPMSPVANGGEERPGNAELNRSAPMASSAVAEECCQGRDSAVETRVSTSPEIGNSDTRLVSSQTEQDIGESSFSVVDPLASLMNNSGPIAYSGSISLRSESSTASTRSFAFPILQSEWNSSPVKMVKADRRHYRKYRGWREGLLCCKF